MERFTDRLTRRHSTPESADSGPEGPMSLEHRIERLRELMQSATDLSTISDYFHDTLAGDNHFIALGDPSENERLVKLVEAALSNIEGEN